MDKLTKKEKKVEKNEVVRTRKFLNSTSPVGKNWSVTVELEVNESPKNDCGQ